MELDYIKLLTESIVGVSVVVTVILFIRYIRSRDTDLKDQQNAFLKIISNHMESEVEAFAELSAAIKAINGKKRK